MAVTPTTDDFVATKLDELAASGVDLSEGSGAGGRAYVALRAGILRDLLPPKTRLSEAELAAALGVSRTPVRSALQMLLQEGLVETGPKRQIFVRGFSPAERHEVVLVREALEQTSIAEASRVIKLSEIDELRLVLMRQRRAADRGDIEAFIDLDDQFHTGIARYAQLPLLEKLLGQLRAFIRLMGLRAVTHEGRMSAVLEEHEAILAALETRDTEAALAALDDHLSNTYALLGHPDEPGAHTPPSLRLARSPSAEHISELAAHGVAPPDTVPTFYEVSPDLLMIAPPIVSAASPTTSGEAEPVLIRLASGEQFIGVGSDHTDREIEKTSVLASKRACPKPLGREVWPLDAVSGRWGDLVVASHVNGERLYQEASAKAMLRPEEILALAEPQTPLPTEPLVLFLGTVPLIDGHFHFGTYFRAELRDPAHDRSLICEYGLQHAGPAGVAGGGPAHPNPQTSQKE